MSNILLTTTDILQGKNVEYFGVVYAEAFAGADFIKDFQADLKNFFGGRIKGYEKEVIELKKLVHDELIERAKQQFPEVNAIIGIQYETIVFGQSGFSIALIATGTAVNYR